MLNFFPSNFRNDIHFSSRWISAKQLPNRGRCENFGAKLTHLCEFLRLLIGRIIFITRAITSFAILIGRIIFLKCELQLFACENLWHISRESISVCSKVNLLNQVTKFNRTYNFSITFEELCSGKFSRTSKMKKKSFAVYLPNCTIKSGTQK